MLLYLSVVERSASYAPAQGTWLVDAERPCAAEGAPCVDAPTWSGVSDTRGRQALHVDLKMQLDAQSTLDYQPGCVSGLTRFKIDLPH